MPEAKCWLCRMYFDFDATDSRPWIYHEHPDGTLVGLKNPNLERKPLTWKKYDAFAFRKENTLWQDFK